MRLTKKSPLNKIFNKIIPALIILSASSCSFNRMLVDEAAGFMQKGRAAFEREPDLEIAETALASNLKLLEALLQADPDNKKLSLFLAEGYALYALAFAEDRYEERLSQESGLAENDRLRAIMFYRRARDYAGAGILREMHLSSIDEISRNNLAQYLDKQKKADVPKLFWFAFSWVTSINLQRDNVAELVSIPYVEMIMTKVKQLDDTYYFGGVYLFEGMFYGGRPAMLGGNPERSLDGFARAEEISKKKILLVPYFKAATYCIQQQDLECFQKNLEYVINAPDDIYPEQMLANALAKKKARRLLNLEQDYFLANAPD